jgi:hypothetical protein
MAGLEETAKFPLDEIYSATKCLGIGGLFQAKGGCMATIQDMHQLYIPSGTIKKQIDIETAHTK